MDCTKGTAGQECKSIALLYNLHYVKSGRLVVSTGKESPFVPLQAMEPNRRLIRELSVALRDLGVSNTVFRPMNDCRMMLKREHPYHINIQQRIFIDSRPYSGISYIHVTICNPSNYPVLGDQIQLSFVANTVKEIIEKLEYYNVLSITPDSTVKLCVSESEGKESKAC